MQGVLSPGRVAQLAVHFRRIDLVDLQQRSGAERLGWKHAIHELPGNDKAARSSVVGERGGYPEPRLDGPARLAADAARRTPP